MALPKIFTQPRPPDQAPEDDVQEVEAGSPWPPRPADGRTIRQIARPRRAEKTRERERVTPALLATAALLITGGLAGAAYVVYESQALFQAAHNHGDGWRAAVSAALPELGWVALALIATVAALRGRSALRARVGAALLFGLSTTAQLMYAERTASGWVAAIIAPVVLAYLLETFLVELRRWAAARLGVELRDNLLVFTLVGRSVGRVLRLPLRLGLFALRYRMDRAGTRAYVRGVVLETAPVWWGRTALTEQRRAELATAADHDRQIEELRSEVERVREQERARADERLREHREQSAELLGAMARELETTATTPGQQAAHDGPHRRWSSKAEGFRQVYAELRDAGDPRVLDPNIAISTLATQIAEMVIGEDGRPMSPSQARAVLYEIYRDSGRPGENQPTDQGRAVPAGSGMISGVNGS